MHRSKTSICCAVVRRDTETGKLGCGFRWPRLLDFTTDSWRSKIVVVLIFIAVYLQLGVLIMGSLGITTENYTKLESPYDCLAQIGGNSTSNSAENRNSTELVPNVSSTMPSEAAPVNPNGSNGLEWVVAFSVVIIVGLMGTGVSSRQHIILMIMSFLVLLITTVSDIVNTFGTGLVTAPQIFRVLGMVDGWYCAQFAIPTLVRMFLLITIKLILVSFVVYYFVAHYFCGKSGDDYDEWRLRKAYQLTRRLATPIPIEEMPKQPPPYLNFLFRLQCCRKFDESLYASVDMDVYSHQSALELDHSANSVGLLSGESKKDALSGARKNCCSRNAQRVRQRLFNTFKSIIISIKDILTPATPTLHSVFEKSDDHLYSARFIMAIGTCITFMLLVSAVVFGVLLSAANRLTELIQKRVIERFNLPEFFIEYAHVVANDIRIAGGLACATGFLMVLIVSFLTMMTYKDSIYKLRQRQNPFRVQPTTYSASFYIGHQLSHFLLSFFICFVLFALVWIVGRVFYLVEFIRAPVLRFLLTILVPTIVNFTLQFIFKLIFSSWDGRNLRYRFAFQFLDIANTTISTLTSILPSITRIITQLALQMLLCARLDLPSMFPFIDSAHGSFVAMVYQDHFNNNPVKLVFVDQLLSLIKNAELDAKNLEMAKNRGGHANAEVSRRMRRRWRLMLLLAKYPQLRKERKRALLDQKAILMRDQLPLAQKRTTESDTSYVSLDI